MLEMKKENANKNQPIPSPNKESIKIWGSNKKALKYCIVCIEHIACKKLQIIEVMKINEKRRIVKTIFLQSGFRNCLRVINITHLFQKPKSRKHLVEIIFAINKRGDFFSFLQNFIYSIYFTI